MAPRPPAPPVRASRGPRAPKGPRQDHRVLALQPVPARRLIAVYLVLCAGLGGLGIRLAWLQLVEGGNLEARARSIQTKSINPIGERRTIVDRTGSLVATGETFALVKTSVGLERCEDRRNLQTSDEALLFKRHQTKWRREQKAAIEEGRKHG